MCDFSGKLIAWLDRELPGDEAAALDLHIQSCKECQSDVDAFQQVTAGFETYCAAAMSPQERRIVPHWVPIFSGVAATAAVVAAIFFMTVRHKGVTQPVSDSLSPTVISAIPTAIDIPATSEKKKISVHGPDKRIYQRPDPIPQQTSANWISPEPSIQIAVPADAMFPPGALPDGINFTADVSIAADGSTQLLRLRPRLIGFERSTTQP